MSLISLYINADQGKYVHTCEKDAVYWRHSSNGHDTHSLWGNCVKLKIGKILRRLSEGS